MAILIKSEQNNFPTILFVSLLPLIVELALVIVLIKTTTDRLIQSICCLSDYEYLSWHNDLAVRNDWVCLKIPLGQGDASSTLSFKKIKKLINH